ncbi:histone deacetylase family protein [Vulcanisaeta souniana]|uniref:Acetylpolyamine amidohydrolase n=1 Tax=Vulcanisaeta souniana JCM 11219 TaxID=1293586 RepID=A0A830EE50_9CREN|nr:histone deacetylase family protein [Vulcanisaeta souniana]BDR92075.1 acetylpolyamine amidohydrolase [Vulcanisaeta souniana JCM 11219]GGI68080.1 acetylpolyamine amidohydrolase [Vulcanisaeta souniana JCM 11219]
MIGVIYDYAYLEHRPPGNHVERPDRVVSIIKAVNGLAPVERPIKDVDEWLLKVHDADYVSKIDQVCSEGYVFIDADTYVSPGTCRAARLAVGAVLRGIDKVLSGEWNAAYAIVRPPGHHVGRNGKALMAPTQGFCIFNNTAVGAVYALEHGAGKVAILDVDAHHGNGTQEIFYSDPRVLYLSLHQDPLTIYPGTGFIDEVGEGYGEGFNVNVPLPPFTADDAYQVALNGIVWPIIEEFKPRLILVSLGFDAHELDGITNLRLSLNTYAEVFRRLRDFIGRVGGVVFVLEGGYNNDVLSRGSVLLMNIMSNKEMEIDEGITRTEPRVLARVNSVIRDVISTQRVYWHLG